MALVAVQRNALLEEVWAHLTTRDYVAIAQLVGGLPLEDHISEPELGVILCYAWYQLGELDRSLWLVERLADVSERRGNTWLSRRRLNCEGVIRVARGELDAAEPLLSEVLERAERSRDTQLKAWAYNNLGISHAARGNWLFALSHFRRAIVAGQVIGDLRHISLCYMNMADSFRRLGQLKEARAHLDLAADFARDTASPTELAYIEHNRAFIHLDEGDLPLARATAARSRHRFESLNNARGMAISTELQGRLMLKEGRLAEARASFQAAHALAIDLVFPALEADSLEQLGIVSRFEGDIGEFTRCVRVAIGIYTRMGSCGEVTRLRNSLSTVDDLADHEEAPD